jgi:hypothetical protein
MELRENWEMKETVKTMRHPQEKTLMPKSGQDNAKRCTKY